MNTVRRKRLTLVLAAVLATTVACNGNSDLLTTDPNDSDAPLSDVDALLDGAPSNDDLLEDGKYDAVYPETFTELVALQSPVKSQGSRGVCSIFSTVGLMEHLYISEGTLPGAPDFSEQFLQWSVKFEVGDFPNTGGSSARSNLRAINQYGIVAEADHPYETQPWNTSDDERCTGDDQPTVCYTNGEPPQSALDATRWRLPPGRYVNSRPRSIKAFLTENRTAVIAGMTFFYQSWNHRRSTHKINSNYWSEGYVLYPNDADKAKSLESRVGHSIVIVGWDDNLEVPRVDENGDVMKDADGNELTEKGFWLFKNSWGTGGFGIRHPSGAGYGWLSMQYVQEYASVYGSAEPVLDLVETCDDGIDNDYNGAIDCDDEGCANHEACSPTGLSFSNNTPTAIPDNDPTGATSPIAVAQMGSVGTVTVNVYISHTYIGDLTVTLIGPDGTRSVLHDRSGSSTDDIRQTYTPTDFAGRSITGDWTLEVIDHANADTGTINSWSVAFTLSDTVAEVCDDQIDNDANGDTDCADAACAAFPACQGSQTVSETNDANLSIPDNDSTGIESTIEITTAGQISSLTVNVDITHTFRADLIVKLRHPGGTEVVLHNQEGLGEQNLVRSYTPPELNGLPAAGTWTLVVIDDAAQDVGTLNSWGVDLEILP